MTNLGLSLLIVILQGYIYGLELTMKKVHMSMSLFDKTIRSLSNNSDDNYISLKRKIEGLYTIEIALGSNQQKFNVIFDTGSSLSWFSDSRCKNCLSSNRFNSNESDTFFRTEERMSLNYLTGRMSGFISKDQFRIGNYSSINNFTFLLGDDITATIEIDGLLGLHKYYNKESLQFSIINSLYRNEIINSKEFTVDCTKTTPKVYIGETPSYLTKNINQSRCSCSKEVKYWNCKASVQIGEFKPEEDILLLFDTGTNGLVIPKDMFNDIKEHLFPIDAFDRHCHISSSTFVSISCTKEFIDNRLMKNNMIFILNNSHVVLNVSALFNNDNNFIIYFGNVPHGGWLIGQPFFEQYATMFNHVDNSVTVYLNDNRENITPDDKEIDGTIDKPADLITNSHWTIVALNIAFWIFGVLLVIGMVLITYIWWKRKRIPMEMIGYEAPILPLTKNDF